MTEQERETVGITEEFWRAAAEGRLIRQVCDTCGSSFFSPREACPACRSTSWRWQESAGRGTIYSFSRVHRSPVPEIVAPYMLGVVDLDEGWTMLTHLVGDAGRKPVIGMPVAVRMEAQPGGAILPVFDIVAEGGN